MRLIFGRHKQTGRTAVRSPAASPRACSSDRRQVACPAQSSMLEILKVSDCIPTCPIFGVSHVWCSGRSNLLSRT